jgi:hypothetical protein
LIRSMTFCSQPTTARFGGWRWSASQGFCCSFCFCWGALYCSMFLLMWEFDSQKKKECPYHEKKVERIMNRTVV